MSKDQSDRGVKSAGKVMLTLFWITVLAILALIFERREDRLLNPNVRPTSSVDSSGLIEVVLQRNRKGHYLSGGLINDTTVTFLLDTGATDVVVPGELAERIGLKPESRGYAVTAAGTVPVYRTMLDRVEVGDIGLNAVTATINPHMEGNHVLLGMSALRQIEFLQRGDQLRLRQVPNQLDR